MSETPEQIELHELDQGNVSDTTSEVSTVTSSVGSKFKEELEDSENDSDSSDGDKAEERSSISKNKGKQPASKSSDQQSSGSENSSDNSSDEGESIAPVIPTRNKGKQPASEGPRSILKKDTGKQCAIVPVPKNNKSKTKRCTRCNRPVSRIHRRSLPSNVNSTAEEATDLNTIYNLEGYHTSDPVTILCDRCTAVGKTLDRYKRVTVIGDKKKFVKDTNESRRMRKKYRTAVVEREKALARSERRKQARASGKTATVAFAEGSYINGGPGVRSDAASAASVASTVSFGPLPEPVDGVGAVRRATSFQRGKRHYKPGRWSWEATWERGDLEEYDYDEDCASSDGNASSLASTIVESSAMGAARGAEPEDREENQGWLDTSGLTIMPQDFYDGVKNPTKVKMTRKISTPTDINTAHGRYHFDPETRTIRRQKEPTPWEYLKELAKFWCCLK